MKIGGRLVTFFSYYRLLLKNWVFIYFLSSKQFLHWKSVEMSWTAARFWKILSYWFFFFKKLQNYRRQLPNGSFDRKFYAENGTFFDKVNMWWDMTSYALLFMYDVTKSLKMRKWRHISSHAHFIKKCPVTLIFFIRMS